MFCKCMPVEKCKKKRGKKERKWKIDLNQKSLRTPKAWFECVLVGKKFIKSENIWSNDVIFDSFTFFLCHSVTSIKICFCPCPFQISGETCLHMQHQGDT